MASNLNILTYNAPALQAEQQFYTPVITVQGNRIATIFAFMGRVDSWPIVNGTETPVQPTQTTQYIKQTFNNIFAVKQLYTNNISPVIQRIDWNINSVYYPYDDTSDVLAKDANGFLLKSFYVRNRYDQVFKCLWNNNGGPSTFEPIFAPGTYGTNNIFSNAGDGYKWKYIYTVDASSKKTFMDSTWMPVPVGINTPDPYNTTAGIGSIDVVNVTNGGSGYDPINTFIVANIIGDGVGASANVTAQQVSNGQITDIVVGNAGSNYTNANVTITAYTSANLKFVSTVGSGVTAVAPTSPVGGHGFDPLSELGCTRAMYSVEFNSDEGGLIPTDPEYRQVGLLINPSDYTSYPAQATQAIYNTTTQFYVASGQGVFSSGEVVQQRNTSGVLTFAGTVVSFGSSTNVLQVINTSGSFTVGQSITGLASGTARTILSASLPQLIPFSGYIAYIENRVGVQRSPDGIEQFKFVVQYA